MADFNLDDIEEMTVELELEDGKTLVCEVIYIFEWNGDDYAVLTPEDDSIEEIYFFGIEIADNGGAEPEITLLEIEDEETLEALADAFDELLDEEEFGEDEDEQDEDDDDGRWDEFIHKKLD